MKICTFIVGRIHVQEHTIDLGEVTGIYKDRNSDGYWVKRQPFTHSKPAKTLIHGLSCDERTIISRAASYKQLIDMINNRDKTT